MPVATPRIHQLLRRSSFLTFRNRARIFLIALNPSSPPARSWVQTETVFGPPTLPRQPLMSWIISHDFTSVLGPMVIDSGSNAFSQDQVRFTRCKMPQRFINPIRSLHCESGSKTSDRSEERRVG